MVLDDLTHSYDKAGRRIATGGSFARTGLPQSISTATYNAANQQLTLGNRSMTYDLNGNLATLTDPSGTTTYTWNARNQLVSLNGPNVTANFQYDAFSRRLAKTINGSTTEFVYDGLNPVQELASGTPTANLLTGLGIDEYFSRTDIAGTRSFLPDALGSTLALTDSVGTIQTEYTYEPFGNMTVTGASSTNPFQYTGRENDGTELYHYRARYYHPVLQRFISEDPIGFAGGDVNLYAYVGNNPANFVDPFGLFPPSTAGEGEFLGNIGDAAGDFYRNYQDMRNANTIGADAYFHCKANCEAAQGGAVGEGTAGIISEGRELFDQYIQGDSPQQCNTDRAANQQGRQGAGSGQLCNQVCNSLRPQGLPLQY